MRRADSRASCAARRSPAPNANLDLFVFPSQTDTFATSCWRRSLRRSCLVSSRGGPKSVIQFNQTGAGNGPSGPSGPSGPVAWLPTARAGSGGDARFDVAARALNRMREAALERAREFRGERLRAGLSTYEDCLLRIGDVSTGSIPSPQPMATPDVQCSDQIKRGM